MFAGSLRFLTRAHSNLSNLVRIDGAPTGNFHESCCNFVQFFSCLTQDIQGDIRHPVDYLVDLVETKVGKTRPALLSGESSHASAPGDDVMLHDVTCVSFFCGRGR